MYKSAFFCGILLLAVAAFKGSARAEHVELAEFDAGLRFKQPVDAAFYGSAGLLVVERGGKIIDAPARKTFLDIGDVIIARGSEQGLLGLALHPDFPRTPEFYVYYTASPDGRVVVSHFSAKGGAADRSSEQVLLTIPQPYSNHNGGSIRFGPDRMLYLGVGDGGSGGDPQGYGQKLDTLLGKVLRIDVLESEGARPASAMQYAIPKDNPFVSRSGTRPEIYAYGLRNPWRFSFDRVTGQLWLADVGQNRLEEVDVVEAGGNYGWNIMEGSRCFKPEHNCGRQGLVQPRAEYGRNKGISITGGYVYRGKKIPAITGWYIFGDFGSGTVFGLSNTKSTLTERAQPLLESGLSISSFAEDSEGELYLLDYGRGRIMRLVVTPD